MTALLDIRDLAIRFDTEDGTVEAVRGISLGIEAGETLALVGESGSGKSLTALSTVHLLPEAARTQGAVRWKGEDILHADPATLRRIRGNDISFIFQEPMTSLNPLHTIETQVGESLKLHQGLPPRPWYKRFLSAWAGLRPLPVLLALFGLIGFVKAYLNFVALAPDTPSWDFLPVFLIDCLGKGFLYGAVASVAITGALWTVALGIRQFLGKALVENTNRDRVIQLLEQVGIRDPEDRVDAYPHQLSGGQRQRVMIAMALANDPELLIADEPTTALDVTIQAQILDLLADLQRERGLAMLFITHDLGIVRKVARRVAVMQNGEIVETGPVAEVFDNPQHAYTQKLLAAEPKGGAGEVAETTPVLLEAEKVRVWFPIRRGLLKRTVGHIKAVTDIDVTLRRGETLGVVGESGSGKTTLALALMRLIGSEGAIRFDGQDIHALSRRNLRTLRRDMQIVFQDPYGSLSPRMSVAEIVAEGLGVHGLRDQGRSPRDAVAEALTEVGLQPEMMDRYPHEFSGGQRQRIAIARAMILKPKFVVLI